MVMAIAIAIAIARAGQMVMVMVMAIALAMQPRVVYTTLYDPQNLGKNPAFTGPLFSYVLIC